MKTAYLLTTLFVSLIITCPILAETVDKGSGESKNKATIAIVQDGQSQLLNEQKAKIKKELNVLVDDDFVVIFKDIPDFNANWKLNEMDKVLNNALNDPEVDYIITIGPLVTHAAIHYKGKLSKPVIGGGLYEDVDALGLLYDDKGRSLVPNFTFVVVPFQLTNDLKVFKSLIPFKKVHILVDSAFIEGTPDTEMNEATTSIEKKSGVELVLVPMDTKADDILAQLDDKIEAVYITPPLRMNTSEFQKLIAGINVKKIPSFSMMGIVDVEKGVLAGQAPILDKRHARRSALNIQQILMGTSPNELSVFMPIDEKLTINGKTAHKIGFNPNFQTLLNANVLYWEDLQSGKLLTMEKSIQIALKNNINLAIKKSAQESARQDKNIALSSMFPQLDGNTRYYQVDKDRAETSMGLQPENRTSARISVSQMVFSDSIISNFRATGQTYLSSKLETETQRLDIIESAAKYFLSYLSSEALLKIETDNLKLTQKNLDLARLRKKVGTSGPEEVYRWEAEEAQQKSSVINAEKNVQQTRIALNQVLGIDQNTKWTPQNIILGEREYYFLDDRLKNLVYNQEQLINFENFLVSAALENSPEIQTMNHAIKAQKVLLGLSKRRFILPDVYAGFSYDRELSEKVIGPTLSDPIFSTEEPDRNEWMATLSASLPLFEGGGRFFKVAKNKADLEKTIEKKTQVSQLVEQRTRTAVLSIGSSWPNIQLSRQAAESAHKNLDIVQDKYAQGTVSILDLLDAQNQSFSQDQAATIAVYTYMEDIVELQRSASWFEIDKNPEEKEIFLTNLEAYFNQHTAKKGE
ncbi:MAG: ABC transporter substrate binding protein [Candidatus Theseobacter exili]|nr:ABC transporter substrate binding protein [Candidatus Theseobacter exili]